MWSTKSGLPTTHWSTHLLPADRVHTWTEFIRGVGRSNRIDHLKMASREAHQNVRQSKMASGLDYLTGQYIILSCYAYSNASSASFESPQCQSQGDYSNEPMPAETLQKSLSNGCRVKIARVVVCGRGLCFLGLCLSVLYFSFTCHITLHSRGLCFPFTSRCFHCYQSISWHFCG